MAPNPEDKSNSETTQKIVVTGFGLFRGHLLNPSWEAIRDGQLVIDRPNIEVIAKQINVSYQDVDKTVEELWTVHKPLFMVHIGLAAHETAIRIEQKARHGPFIHDDVVDYAPHKDLRIYQRDSYSFEENVKRHSYTCRPCSFDTSSSCFDIDRLCLRLNQYHEQGKVPLAFKPSHDAGLYVCEYIYQKSLQISDRAIFIHVPDVANFKLEDIRMAIKLTIEELLDQENEIST